MKRFSWPALFLANSAHFILYMWIGGCGSPSSPATDRPSFPYPEGGLNATDAAPNPDAPAPDIAGPVDAGAPDVRSVSDRPLPDVPVGDNLCPASCDDHNPCTVDSCDTTIGACVNSFADDGSPCDSLCLAGGQGFCTFGVCKGTPADDGTFCTDYNPCTVGDSCQGGLCFSGSPMACPAIDICHGAGHCEPATGACTSVALDGNFCDDGVACTTGDQCIGGACLGTRLTCSAAASCEDATGICIVDGQPAFPSATLALTLALSTAPSLALDNRGNLFVVGSLLYPTDLGAGLLVPAGSQNEAGTKSPNDVLVAKINTSTGQAVWSGLFGDQQEQVGRSIAVNRQGQVAVTGLFVGSLVFGSTTITNPNAASNEAFVAGVDASTGAGLWVLRPRLGSNVAIAADPTTSDFFVCGSAADVPASGLVPKAAAADDGDIVVARLDARTGVPVWGHQISAFGRQTCESIAVDASGHVVLAGEMVSLSADADAGSAALDFGSGIEIALPVPLPRGGSTQVIWVAVLDADAGGAIRASSLAAPQGGRQVVQQVACDEAGNIILVGGMVNSALVGTTTLTSAGGQDALAVKLDTQLVPLWARNWGGPGSDLANSVAIGPAGTLLLAGSYVHSIDLDGISLSLGPASSTSPSTFLARVDAATGTVTSARGYGASGASQTPSGVLAAGAGQDAGAWLAGTFTGLLQMGPPASLLHNSGASVGFLARIAP